LFSIEAAPIPGAVTAFLIVFAGIVCLVPTRRAASVDPMQPLQYE
jgi:ABC-type lipoprotein release transport system permease subunit